MITKILPILLPLCITAHTTYDDGSIILDVTRKSAWKAALNDLPDYGSLFVMFHTPWCHFCKRVRPQFELAAKAYDEWPHELLNPTKFAHVDCEASNQLCSAAGIYLYPTMSYIDKKGTMREELPVGSRRAESILADIAKKRRKALPIQVTSYEDFKFKRAANLRSCWGARRPITDYSYQHSLCLGMKTSNYMIGTNSSLTRINQRFRNAGVGLVQFAFPDDLLPPELASKTMACILNQYDFTERECVETNVSDTELDKTGKVWLNSFYETPVVDYGTWENFYALKTHDSKKMLLVVAVDNYSPSSKQPYIQAALEKQDGWFTMLIDREDPQMTSIITEMGLTLAESPLIAFKPSLEDHAYFPYNNSSDPSSYKDIVAWLESIDKKLITPSYRAGKEPGLINYLKRQFQGMLVTLDNLRDNVPLSVWLKITIIGCGFIASWFGLVWFTGDMEEKAPAVNSSRLAPLYEESKQSSEDGENTTDKGEAKLITTTQIAGDDGDKSEDDGSREMESNEDSAVMGEEAMPRSESKSPLRRRK